MPAAYAVDGAGERAPTGPSLILNAGTTHTRDCARGETRAADKIDLPSIVSDDKLLHCGACGRAHEPGGGCGCG